MMGLEFGKYIIDFYYSLGFIQQQPKRKRIFNQPPIVSYKKKNHWRIFLSSQNLLPTNNNQEVLQTWRKFIYDRLNRIQTVITQI